MAIRSVPSDLLARQSGAFPNTEPRSPLAALHPTDTRPPVLPAVHAGRPAGSLLLPVDAIDRNQHNPRQSHDEAELDQLAESIKRWGQLQPVLVRRVNGRYELICGERRLMAHRRAGITTIWAVERDATDEQALALALVENLQRVDLSQAEKVAALDLLADLAQVRGLRKTARELHVDAGWLSRQLAIRRDPIIFRALESGQLGFGQAAELLRAPVSARAKLVDRTVGEERAVTTATVRQWVEAARAGEPGVNGRSRAHRDLDWATAAAADSPPQARRRARPDQYESLVVQLEALGPPRTDTGRAALRDLIERAKHYLSLAAEPNGSLQLDGGKRVAREYTCLMCGELAALQSGKTLRPARTGSVRTGARGMRCGRCGGTLLPDGYRVVYSY